MANNGANFISIFFHDLKNFCLTIIFKYFLSSLFMPIKYALGKTTINDDKIVKNNPFMPDV